ncbi:LamG-like jellyroll fold domain-containing protein [Marinoscillum sp.]|uniref:LamG-like jellyroll fold domain-containing protein n=1 Tax=Marinoscillum sp. TaxID=2024838 RepID=UPI003BABC26E
MKALHKLKHLLITGILAILTLVVQAQDFTEDFDSGLPPSTGSTDLSLKSGDWGRTGVQSEETGTKTRNASTDAAYIFSGSGNFLITPKLFNASDISFWYRVDAPGADGFVFDVLASSDGGTTYDIVIADNQTSLSTTYAEFTHTFGESYTGPIKIATQIEGDSHGLIEDFSANFTTDFSENFDTGLPPSTGTTDLTLTSGIWKRQGVQSDEAGSSTRNGSTDAAFMFSGGGNYLQSPTLTDVAFVQFWYRVNTNNADGFVFDVLGSSDGGTTFDITLGSAVTTFDQTYKRFVYEFGSAYTGPVKIQFNGIGDSNGFIDDFIAGAGVAEAPDISFITPAGTEEVKFGAVMTIHWDNVSLVGTDNYTLYYRKVGAASWTAIASRTGTQLATGTGNEMSYDWTVPDFGSDLDFQAELRVVNTTQSWDEVSPEFRVYFESGVAISSPADTDQRKFGETMDITWTNGDIGTGDYYQLYYSNDGGSFVNFYSGYIYNLTNSGSESTYTWTIPDFGSDSASQVRVRVVNATRAVSDTSEAFRVYYEPSVTISSPTDTDQRKFGETMDITWTNGDIGTGDYYQLYYSNDGGTFVNFYSGYIYNLTNSGSESTYTWTIPDFGSDSASQVRVRVVNATRAVSDTSEAFRVYYEPSVTISSPTDTDQRKFGETMDITWTNGDIGTGDYYQLYYSNDGGSFINFYNGYIYNLTNSGSESTYTWTIPDFGSDSASQVRVRVVNATRAVSDTSKAFRVYYEPSVTISSPTDTDQRKFRETMDITWTNGDIGTGDYYQLYYSNDGGSFINFYNGYIYNLTNSGSESTYTWTIPDFGSDSASQVRVRVVNATRAVSDTSEAFRVYYEPSVDITSPFAGEYVLQGSSKKVTWTNGDIGTGDYFQLYYSNGGSFINFYNGYIYNLTNDGKKSTYNWTVPAIEGTNVKIRVVNATRAVSDTTKSFTICSSCPALAVFYPNGGEVLGVGNSAEIGWSVGTAWEATDEVLIELSQDGGATYEASPVFSGTYAELSGNAYEWTIPDLVTTEGLIRLSNVTKETSDESDAVFTITRPPAAPTDFTATEDSNGAVILSWTDNADNETSYRVQYSSDNVSWANYSGFLGADTETYTAGVSVNSAYWWRVEVASSTFTETSASRFAGNILPPGKALSFDGTDDYVELANPTNFDFGTGDFTIEGWVKSSNVTSTQVIASDYSGGDSFFVFYMGAGQLKASLSNTTADLSTSAVLEYNTWHHVAMVRSGDALTLYVDGVSSANVSGMSSKSVASASNVELGRQALGSPYYLNGELDEFRFWNVARTQGELTSASVSTLTGEEPGLVAYYRFDHSAGSSLADYASGNNQGSWTGTGGANTTAKWVTSGATISNDPVITLTTPNGGEELTVGQEYEITWTTTNTLSTDMIEIRFSSDGGENYEMIAEGTSESLGGSYLWTVPDMVTTSARIEVANTSEGVSDASDADFSIGASQLGVTLLTPNGGEFWEIGTVQVISWEPVAFADIDLLEIRLSLDGGETFNVLSEGNSSSFQNNQLTIEVPEGASEMAIVEVANITQEVADASDEPFTIGTVDRSITVTAPNGGETWEGASAQTISWEVMNKEDADLIEIRLSTDGGETFSILNDGTFGTYPDNTFQWTVADSPTESALIAVVNTSRNIGDTTDAVFTITPAPDITAPNFTNSSAGSVVGDDYSIDVTLDEEATVYLLILSDQSSVPNATQIKEAATGVNSFQGQVAVGQMDYTTPAESVTLAGTSTFVRNSLYDFYLTAEDASGNLNAGLGRPNVRAQLTPLESDSVIVSTIYDVMGGADWSDIADGWIDLPLAQRAEITIEGERITGLNLSGKSVTGVLPEVVTGLDALKTLDLSNNHITGLANMSEMSNLTSLLVADNALLFGALEPNSTLFSEPADYAPQAVLGEKDSVAIPKGSTYAMSHDVGGSNTSYQWSVDKFNTYAVDFSEATGGTSSTYTVEAIDFNNMGTYKVEAVNTLLPGLTLVSEPVQVWATATLDITVIGENDALLASGKAYALRDRGPGVPYDSIPKRADGTGDPNGLAIIDGHALFEDLLLGNYLVGIRADPAKFLPTYYTNTYLWEEADVLDFKGDLEATMQMTVLPPGLGPGDGDGSIFGGIESDFGEDEGGRVNARRKVKRAGCSMRRFVRSGRQLQDGSWELIAYVESDDEGRFKFDFMPAGTYRFNIEYPGIPMDPNSFVEFEVGEDGGNNSIELQAVITEDGIFVERINTLGFTKGQLDQLNVYPNPASDQLNIDYSTLHRGFVVRMLDLSGTLIYERQITDQGARLELDTYALKNGMYFIDVTDPGKPGERITYKVIIKH